MEKKKIGIIGASTSGFLACKYMLSKGFDPVVFEARSGTTKLQSPKPWYQFLDFPWSSSVTEDFPTQHQVFDYIQSYAQYFDLIKHIRLNTKVIGIEYDHHHQGLPDDELEMFRSWKLWNGDGQPFQAEGKWKFFVEDTLNNSKEECTVYKVDFVILCVGRFSDVPNISEFPLKKGPEAFHGKVINSMDYAAMDYQSAANFVKGKRVIVVGFRKSALDIAMECSVANVLYQSERWNVPDYYPWGFPLAKDGCFSFCEEGILVDGGEEAITTPLKTDLVILATGFRGDKKLKDIFVSQTFQDFMAGSPSETLPLYREIIHPRIPQLAVIGFSESYSNLFTSEMRVRWLAELLDVTFKLPSIKEMENDIMEWDQYMKRYSGRFYRILGHVLQYRRSCIGALHIWYNDQLCKDMGWNLKRKNGFFTKLFEPYGPLDYVPVPSMSN
ncbi:hypothetical protein ACOSQ4_006038 [Xanthoceras sorbifolium]